MKNRFGTSDPHGISRRDFLSLAGLALLAACAPAPRFTPSPSMPTRRPAAPVYPDGDTWQTSSAAEQGIDPAGIDAMLEKIRVERYPTHAFLLARGGCLVAEHYFSTYARGRLHMQRSITKSVVSTLTGIAIAEGLLSGVDQKVLDFFPGQREQLGKGLDPQLEDLKIRHLLSMTHGHSQPTTPDPDQAAVDWTKQFFQQDISCPPGSCFLYDNEGPHLMAAILKRVTGKSPADYAREKLFGPLGITEFTWTADGQGVNYGYSFLELRPIDMLKFGYLFLREGRWADTQIVPKEWVSQATSKQVETKGMMNRAEDYGYGFNWWRNGFDGYSAHGASGQYIFVLPEYDLTAVFTGGFDPAGFPVHYDLMKEYILPALR